MPANIQPTKDKVQRYLTDLFGSIQIDRDGDFTLRQGSARLFVHVDAWLEANTIVRVYAPTNEGVPASPELFHYVATQGNYAFANLLAIEKDGVVRIILTHTLLGDFIDPEELKIAVFTIASVADQIDDLIKTKFGGRVFHEE